MGITKPALVLMLVHHKRFYAKDEFLPEEVGRSADYADTILKRIFPNLRKLKTEDLGQNLQKAYGVIYSHALGKISAKTATRRLLELV